MMRSGWLTARRLHTKDTDGEEKDTSGQTERQEEENVKRARTRAFPRAELLTVYCELRLLVEDGKLCTGYAMAMPNTLRACSEALRKLFPSKAKRWRDRERKREKEARVTASHLNESMGLVESV
mmetsp:Transcript_92699/g.202908  ORF Transcript_92699/g.202908 Transcript_92699/m.202908 type:complete len:124 (+) Transcript_92699:106-477(+)